MNTNRIAVTALGCIVLAFIIKGYSVLQPVESATQTSFDYETVKHFLYLVGTLAAVITWPFFFKIKV